MTTEQETAEAAEAAGIDFAAAPPEVVAAEIERLLRAAFAPSRFELIDESDDHKGHGGWRPGGATHFRLSLAAPAFAGQSRIARQRAVMRVLKDALEQRVHALALSIEAE
ncbi:MAG: BolA family protein [Pseudomonadota bacterium]